MRLIVLEEIFVDGRGSILLYLIFSTSTEIGLSFGSRLLKCPDLKSVIVFKNYDFSTAFGGLKLFSAFFTIFCLGAYVGKGMLDRIRFKPKLASTSNTFVV